MTDLFLTLLDMSLSASWVILAVILLRLVLKKAPKAMRCALWAIVALRLLCPVSIESSLSLMPQAQSTPEEVLTSPAAYDLPGEISAVVSYPEQQDSFAWKSESYFYSTVPNPDGTTSIVGPISAEESEVTWANICARVWIIGMTLMLAYACFSYCQVSRKVRASIHIGNNVYLCDYIDSPFILGIVKPKIYLSSAMHPMDAQHVLAHERAHLKRRDHWWKPLGFLLLSVYWFNPLIWVAYVLLCRDIELACDERVVRDMDVPEKKAYSEALLKCSVPRRMIAACPLAFGEVGVKERVKSVLSYKKPGFWLILAAVVALVVSAVCLLTDPLTQKPLSNLWEADPDTLVYIDFTAQKAELALTDPEDQSYLLDLLDTVTYNTSPTSQEHRESTSDEYGWLYPNIRLNFGDSETTLYFTYDYSEVWVNDGVTVSYPYAVNDPTLLQSYVADYVTPIYNRETTVQTFSPDTTPYQWIQSVLPENISSITQSAEIKNSYIYTRCFSLAVLEEFLTALKAVPKDAITSGKLNIPESQAVDLSIVLDGGESFDFATVKLYNGSVELMLGLDSESYIQYLINDPAFTAYLQEFSERPRQFATWAGSHYDFERVPATVTHANATISLYRYTDWDYEIVEYEEGAESFGIRCRPKDVDEGWFYFSFWPDGYEFPEDEETYSYSYYADTYLSSMYYPFETETIGAFVVGDRPYSCQVIQYPTGDYVILNEGADSWVSHWTDEYYNAARELPTFASFSYGTGTDDLRTYGDVTIDFTALPAENKFALHYCDWETIAATLYTRSLTLLEVQDCENYRFILCQYGAEYAILVFEADENGAYQFVTRQKPVKNLYLNSGNDEGYSDPSGFQCSYEDGDTNLVLGVIYDEAITAVSIWSNTRDYVLVDHYPALFVADQTATPDWDISFDLHDTQIVSFAHNVNFNGTELQFAAETNGTNALWKTDYIIGCFTQFYDRQSHPGNFMLTEDEIIQFRDILVGLSPEEITPDDQPRELRTGISFCTYDGVQGLGDYWDYYFVYDGEAVNLRLTRYYDSVYENSKEYIFTIRSESLNSFMESLCDPDRTASKVGYNTIPYTAEEEYVEYSHLYASFKIRRLLGWEYEIVEYTNDSTPFGIRCRPEWAEDGWLFVSFWPNGYEPDAEDAAQIVTVWGNDTRSYPADIIFDEPIFSDYLYSNEWTFHRIADLPGDYVVLNENAADWMENGHWSIYDLLCNSTYGGTVLSRDEAIQIVRDYYDANPQPDVSLGSATPNASVSNMSTSFDYHTGIWTVEVQSSFDTSAWTRFQISPEGKILSGPEYSQSTDPLSGPQRTFFYVDDGNRGYFLLRDGWMMAFWDDDLSENPRLFSFWPEGITDGYINVEYHEGTFLPESGMTIEDISLRHAVNPITAKTATREGDSFWSYLWINTDTGYYLFRNRSTEDWSETHYTEAMDMINSVILYTDIE